MVMENYYSLLQKTFQDNESRVTICNYHSTQCMYQVSEMFQKLPSKDQVFDESTCSQMMRKKDLTTIQASESTSQIMLFPFYYLPDKQFVLGIVLRDIGRIYFLDTQHDDDRQQFFQNLFPIFLSTYLSDFEKVRFVYHVTSEDDMESNDSAKFVCLYMYIIMELDRQQKAFDNILQVIEKIKKSTFKKRTILSNVALSLLKKDLSPLALSLNQYGVLYLPKSSNNRKANWCQISLLWKT